MVAVRTERMMRRAARSVGHQVFQYSSLRVLNHVRSVGVREALYHHFVPYSSLRV